jgi:hypothetical protein
MTLKLPLYPAKVLFLVNSSLNLGHSLCIVFFHNISKTEIHYLLIYLQICPSNNSHVSSGAKNF